MEDAGERLRVLVEMQSVEGIGEHLGISSEEVAEMVAGGEIGELLAERIDDLWGVMGEVAELADGYDLEGEDEDDDDEWGYEVAGEELAGGGDELVLSRTGTVAGEVEQRKGSLWNARAVIMMSQFRGGLRYEEQVQAFILVTEVELALISYYRESVPDPDARWDEDRRDREIQKRLARLRWGERELEREYGGLKGAVKLMRGRRRMSGRELYERMVERADEVLGVMEDRIGVMDGIFDGGVVQQFGRGG